jgi:regulator of protease activity HflC (stomatin/prohibitin superfamily)
MRFEWPKKKPEVVRPVKLTDLRPFILQLLIPLVVFWTVSKCLVYVRPNESGIKQVNIGLKTGIQKEIYQTGLYFLMPFGFEVMHRFPRDIQLFELTNSPGTAARGVRVARAAHIQTSDGFFVDVDVSIPYHIVNPYQVITTIGPGQLYEDNGIVPRVEAKLKEAFGEMTTEEFYNSPLRVEKATKAKELLNEELRSKGLEVVNVLVRYFRYSDEIQRNIEEKKLKDQLVFTNQSKAKASGEEALVEKVREEGEAKIKIKLQEGASYVMKRNAEKDLYVRSKRAEADLLMRLAEAKKTEMINTAYQKQGSDKLIGLKMAEVYKGLQAIVLSSGGEQGLNPLDLEKSMKLFGLKQKEL